MKQIVISCAGIDSSRQLHELLHRELALPDWYGHNLDALYDCLTSMQEETSLTFTEFEALPFVTKGFRRVLTDAMLKNPLLKVDLT